MCIRDRRGRTARAKRTFGAALALGALLAAIAISLFYYRAFDRAALRDGGTMGWWWICRNVLSPIALALWMYLLVAGVLFAAGIGRRERRGRIMAVSIACA